MRHCGRYSGIKLYIKYYHFPQNTNIPGRLKYRWLLNMYYIYIENTRYYKKCVKSSMEEGRIFFFFLRILLSIWIEFDNLSSVLVFYGCTNFHNAGWSLKITEMYSLMVLQDRSPKSRYWLGHTSEGSSKEFFFASSNLWSFQILFDM